MIAKLARDPFVWSFALLFVMLGLLFFLLLAPVRPSPVELAIYILPLAAIGALMGGAMRADRLQRLEEDHD